ncbi:unnamed protein product [Linum tenue]|uniref:Serine aminopeptidase S33 domain-containing protein n=1 Tax=Linum tenue TaxID=586396 RepID=A0AAV0GS66_9ROSI|nr:unnamed protein product [Linum tenue]
MDGCTAAQSVFGSPYELLFRALSLIPAAHYAALLLALGLVFLYNFLEIHFLRDLVTGFRGDPVKLTYNASSEVYRSVASKCQVLRGRYLPTPWLSSPHLQTAFLSFFGNPPRFTYKRVLFYTSDGGTIALDWLLHSDVNRGDGAYLSSRTFLQKNDEAPIVIVIPGLTSDSTAPYVKHLVFNMASQGWNVVVSNHRGLGGVQITVSTRSHNYILSLSNVYGQSDCFYNAGWTEDARRVIDHIHQEYPETPLYVVGTSIGANILVKYLGEDTVNVPIVGAAAVCSPWDLAMCDRFFRRRFVQKLYDKVLTSGLVGYAKLHQTILSRLIDWDGLNKRWDFCFDIHFDSHVLFGNSITVPPVFLLNMRMNPNIVLAATKHGGHLGYFEGIAAGTMWWVRAVSEFLEVLHSSPLKNTPRQVVGTCSTTTPLESKIDQGPYVNLMEDGTVAAAGDIQKDNHAAAADTSNRGHTVKENGETITEEEEASNDVVETKKMDPAVKENGETIAEEEEPSNDVVETKKMDPAEDNPDEKKLNDLVSPMKGHITRLARHSKTFIWLLAYVAMVTTWPVVGSGLLLFLKKKFGSSFIPPTLRK